MDPVTPETSYGKVNELEDQQYRSKMRRNKIKIAALSIFLLAIVLAVVAGVTIHSKNSKSEPLKSSTYTLKDFCAVADYPESCISTISALQSSHLPTDPQQLFKLSLRVAVEELSKTASLPNDLLTKEPISNNLTARNLCKEMFDDSVELVNNTISTLDDGDHLLSAPAKINNIWTALSTVLTNHETCYDAMGRNYTSVIDELKSRMNNSTISSRNSLAIVARIFGVIAKTSDALTHNRKLLGFPDWVSAQDRKLLAAEAADIKPNFTVAKDGTGDYEKIGVALFNAPENSQSRFVIYVKEGLYEENLVVLKKKVNIMIYGDGMDKTIVTGSWNYEDGTPAYYSATLRAEGDGFIAKDIGVNNTAGPFKHQAVALTSKSHRSVFFRCLFQGFEGTVHPNAGQQFYRECNIVGTVDFIFGNAAAVFQKCNIMPRQPTARQFNFIVAQGRNSPTQNTATSIQNCTISAFKDGIAEAVTARTFLGRPTRDYSTAIVMQTEIGDVVDELGWYGKKLTVDPPKTIYFAEFQNTGPHSSLDRRVKWAGYKGAVSEAEASKFSVESFIEGSKWLPQTNVPFDANLF